MNEEKWLRIDRSCFFPREGESETAFLLAYHELFHSFTQRSSGRCSWLINAQKQFLHVFHAIPSWVRPSLEKKGLLPWEMAACWQYSTGLSDLKVHPKLLEWKEEERGPILFHELIHAARARLQSLSFEEMIAYEAMRQEKRSHLLACRCVLSRLFLAPSDPLLTLLWHLVLFILTLMNVFSLMAYFGLVLFFWGALTARAVWLFRIWKKAFSSVDQAFPKKAWRFFLRASDSDILWLASLRKQEIFDAIMEKASYDWRWNYFVICTLS